MHIYLEKIIATKKAKLKALNWDVEALKNEALSIKKDAQFFNQIAKPGLSIIGEIKQASPSKGLIKVDFDPVALAHTYASCVDCISVLTEEDHFLGSDEALLKVSQAVILPTLCKDFILEASQIYRAKRLGAQCVLLIVAILEDGTLEALYQTALSIGLDVLIEVHTEAETIRALALKPKMIGINNRNLDTFETTLDTTLKLAQRIPESVCIISESGIHGPEDIHYLKAVRFDGVLVGESFMRAQDMIAHGRALKAAYHG